MTKYYLIRHAKKDPESAQGVLSKEGENQAHLTATHLKGKPLKAIYTSPIIRASQTAQLIAAKLELPLKVDDRLRERANWGDLSGQSFEEFGAMWERVTRDPTYQPPFGDTAAGAAKRLNYFLQEIALTNGKEAELVVVTHGGILTDFLIHQLPLSELEKWQPDFVARQSSLVAECSITVISYQNSHYQLEELAGLTHLL